MLSISLYTSLIHAVRYCFDVFWCVCVCMYSEVIYQTAREAAQSAATERHRCFQLASQSYASLSGGSSKQHAAAAAQPWLLKAQDARKRMRIANARAALEIFRARNAHRNIKHCVDLHGLHVTEALHVCKLLFVKIYERCSSGAGGSSSSSGGSGSGSSSSGGAVAGGLRIITGQSVGRHARLRPALEAFLKSKNKRFMATNPGELKVFL